MVVVFSVIGFCCCCVVNPFLLLLLVVVSVVVGGYSFIVSLTHRASMTGSAVEKITNVRLSSTGPFFLSKSFLF